jgi:epoxyqueuosine reductase
LTLSPEENEELIRYFRWILTASHKQIQRQTLGSPLSRAGAKGLKRNALIVIANRKMIELKTEVEKVILPDFVELKEWTLQQLFD